MASRARRRRHYRVAATQGTISVGGVSVTLPRSDIFPLDIFHIRRALVGGTMSRAWISFVRGGVTYAISWAHNGSGADPTDWVPSLSGATHIEVDLGSVARSSSEVATITVAALVGAGIPASSVGAAMTISGGSGLVIPPSVDTSDTSLRGMWGAQREDWGGSTSNSDGGTGGTGSIHLGHPSGDRPARIIGAYCWSHSSFRPLLAAASGGSFSGSPGALTVVAQGIPDAVGDGTIQAVIFDEPAEISESDSIWAIYRDDDVGGPRFRTHGSLTAEGNGDIPLSQNILWDTTADADRTDALPSSYTPTVNQQFSIYIMIGVIYELADDSGNYWADGAIRTWIGDQNTVAGHGTTFNAGPALLNSETTHHRFLVPEWTNVAITTVRRVVSAIAAGVEDCRIAWYAWDDLDFPSTTPAELLADSGLSGYTTPNAYNTTVLPTPVQIGTEVIGTGRYVSMGFNYVRSDGLPLVTLALPVYLDNSPGSGGYLNSWDGSGRVWDDNIPGGGGAERAPTSGVNEYRTVGTAMPHDSFAETWPDPFVTSIGDDSPAAIAAEAYLVVSAGIQA